MLRSLSAVLQPPPSSSRRPTVWPRAAADNITAARLVGGSSPAEGRLELQWHGAAWGTVCNKNFDVVAAEVACRQMGLGGGGIVLPTVVRERAQPPVAGQCTPACLPVKREVLAACQACRRCTALGTGPYLRLRCSAPTAAPPAWTIAKLHGLAEASATTAWMWAWPAWQLRPSPSRRWRLSTAAAAAAPERSSGRCERLGPQTAASSDIAAAPRAACRCGASNLCCHRIDQDNSSFHMHRHVTMHRHVKRSSKDRKYK